MLAENRAKLGWVWNRDFGFDRKALKINLPVHSTF